MKQTIGFILLIVAVGGILAMLFAPNITPKRRWDGFGISLLIGIAAADMLRS